MNGQIQELQEIIDNSTHIVFFTGAGVSTASGIPDFRSTDGLYNQKYQFPPEEILSHHFFKQHTEEFFRFYRDKMLYPDVKPSFVHQYIATLEKRNKKVTVITQNIDGLHQLAGSTNVLELHGSVLRNTCMQCHTKYSLDEILKMDTVPHCPKCNGIIKPDVVLYEEGLDETILNQSLHALQTADTCIVLGTSLVVYPAAGLLRYFGGDKLVLINRDQTSYDSTADLTIHDDFINIFPNLK
ncbi:NAD-dependent protein deacylase [Solobacterium sp.]|uniref:NAD-dependent protein deacylase n=1 Tax=Solobacterium sp. TaxID=2060878 RepID=UPI001CAB1718|nr:NAD-dependent protein deacylase [Solobacterium sp.]MBF1086526.1 NAD-dependent protein deacylase [Solobacterium sp.]MBF1102247.1 NAD-dependent protein deacylase [Solobacterium sp.]MBF1108842.1 NAD-dependent protein deacylase [Solobacterium sp.]MBF1110032.1 NAD-dependent protein deacylase [Solobacterium sp.]